MRNPSHFTAIARSNDVVRHCLKLQIDRWAARGSKVARQELDDFLSCTDAELEFCLNSPLQELACLPKHLEGTLAGLVAHFRLESSFDPCGHVGELDGAEFLRAHLRT